MDHISNSATETSSLILYTNEMFQKMNSEAPKVTKQAESKRDGVINQQNYNFNIIFKWKMLMLLKRYESAEVDRRTWLHVPLGNHLPIGGDTHQVVEI